MLPMKMTEYKNAYVFERACAKMADKEATFAVELDDGFVVEFAPVGRKENEPKIQMIREVFSKSNWAPENINNFVSEFGVYYCQKDLTDIKYPEFAGIIKQDNGDVIAITYKNTEPVETLEEQLKKFKNCVDVDDAVDDLYQSILAGPVMIRTFKQALRGADSTHAIINALRAVNERATLIDNFLSSSDNVLHEDLHLWMDEYTSFIDFYRRCYDDRAELADAVDDIFDEKTALFRLDQSISRRAFLEACRMSTEIVNEHQMQQARTVANYIASIKEETSITYFDDDFECTILIKPEDPESENVNSLIPVFTHAVLNDSIVMIRYTDTNNNVDRIGGVSSDNGSLSVIPKDMIRSVYSEDPSPNERPEIYYRLPVII